jgi:hypothetical protein
MIMETKLTPVKKKILQDLCGWERQDTDKGMHDVLAY